MHIDPENSDILEGVTFQKDIKGPALFVFWRNVPVGVVRSVDANEVARRVRNVPASESEALSDEYKKLLGKWYDPFAADRYFNTREDAALDLVLRVLRTHLEDSPLIQAAMRKDDAEVMRLRENIGERVGLSR